MLDANLKKLYRLALDYFDQTVLVDDDLTLLVGEQTLTLNKVRTWSEN